MLVESLSNLSVIPDSLKCQRALFYRSKKSTHRYYEGWFKITFYPDQSIVYLKKLEMQIFFE